MEIYNEEINDLFAVENNKLPIHESLEVVMPFTPLHFFLSFSRYMKIELTELSL